MDKISYFEVDAATDQFHRVFAELADFSPHKVTVKIGGVNRVIPSCYNLNHMWAPDKETAPILLAFCHQPAEEAPHEVAFFPRHAQFYPLPKTNRFTPRLLTPQVPALTNDDLNYFIFQQQEIRDLVGEIKRLSNDLEIMFENYKKLPGTLGSSVSAVNLTKAFPSRPRKRGVNWEDYLGWQKT